MDVYWIDVFDGIDDDGVVGVVVYYFEFIFFLV